MPSTGQHVKSSPWEEGPHGHTQAQGRGCPLPPLPSWHRDPSTREPLGPALLGTVTRPGSMGEAASPPLPHCLDFVLFLSRIGRVLSEYGINVGTSSRGPWPWDHGRARQDPLAGRQDQGALVYQQLSLSKTPKSQAVFANPAKS